MWLHQTSQLASRFQRRTAFRLSVIEASIGVKLFIMRQQVVVEDIVLNPLGEILMGCYAYGFVIKTNFGNFVIFKETPILIGHTDHSKCIAQSDCKRYLLVKGGFGTYILDIKDQSISINKTTITIH